MSSGCHFQQPYYRHSEFSLQAKALSQVPLKCVGLFFSLRLHLEVILIIREVVVWCSALPLYIAWDSQRCSESSLARYGCPGTRPLQCHNSPYHSMLFFRQACGESSAVDSWPCKTNFLAVGQLICLPWLWPSATALYKGRISFSWLCISGCQDMLAAFCCQWCSEARENGGNSFQLGAMQHQWINGDGRGLSWTMVARWDTLAHTSGNPLYWMTQ